MPQVSDDTMEDVLERLGGISPRRVLFDPPPGTATVKDVIRHRDGPRRRLVELVDGTLVEKVIGFSKSLVAGELSRQMGNHVCAGNLGVVSGQAGTLKLLGGLVRIPDVAFIAWNRFPNRQVPRAKVPEVVPNLAVEVLSAGNTPREMEIKLKEYFLAGVELVWFVNPDARAVRVFTSPDVSALLGVADTLDGGAVLPGFALPVADLFAVLPAEPKPVRKRKPRK